MAIPIVKRNKIKINQGKLFFYEDFTSEWVIVIYFKLFVYKLLRHKQKNMNSYLLESGEGYIYKAKQWHVEDFALKEYHLYLRSILKKGTNVNKI